VIFSRFFSFFFSSSSCRHQGMSSRDAALSHIFSLLDSDGAGFIEDNEWQRILDALAGRNQESDPIKTISTLSKPITFDEVAQTVRNFTDQQVLF
jgi:hypothetical protein